MSQIISNLLKKAFDMTAGLSFHYTAFYDIFARRNQTLEFLGFVIFIFRLSFFSIYDLCCNAEPLSRAVSDFSRVEPINLTIHVHISKLRDINGCQLKIILYAFKLAQLASFENKNSFELSTKKRG